MKYCSQCGQPLTSDIVAGRERPICKACGHIVYRNPIPVAVVMATQDTDILLVQRANNPLRGYWAPPAGYIEIDETLEAGAAREVKEETGYEVTIDSLLKVYSRPNSGIIFTIYQGRVTGGSPQPDKTETLDIALFAPNKLPHQPAPVEGTEMDNWFFEVISELFATVRAGE